MTERDRLLALSRALSAIEAEARLLKRNFTAIKLLEYLQRELADQLDRERSA